MQTIEEFKEYTAQLEGDVKKWRDAYDASEAIIHKLITEIGELKKSNARLAIKNEILQKSHDATNRQLQELLEEFNKNLDGYASKRSMENEDASGTHDEGREGNCEQSNNGGG